VVLSGLVLGEFLSGPVVGRVGMLDLVAESLLLVSFCAALEKRL
jgi:hypothetical protein